MAEAGTSGKQVTDKCGSGGNVCSQDSPAFCTLQTFRLQTSGVHGESSAVDSQTGFPILGLAIFNGGEAEPPVSHARCVIADNSGTFGKPHTMTHAQHNVNKNSEDLQQNSVTFTMDIIQRQLLQNQQMMLQQQQTVPALVQKFENMSKSLSKNNQPTVSRNSARAKSPEVPVPLITSKSIYDDIDLSEPEYSSADEHILSDRENDNGNDDIKDCFSATSSKRRKTDPATEIIDTPTDPDKESESMKLLHQLGKDFDHDEDLGEKVNPHYRQLLIQGSRHR